ncbi:AraC family transcriptional regulator [Pseudoalteromonas luteoviolacea]|nr:AraC family transcriptional regulator [Pseudoalteromonas luteoviolacea]
MTWSQRMNWAIEYIESNLDSDLTIEEIAKVACCSKYHFHRMFFATFKVTCTDKFGYKSPNAFTRAYRDIHGINPSNARIEGNSLSSYKRVCPPEDNKAGECMNYKIIKVPEFNLIGKSKNFEFKSLLKAYSTK